MKNRFSFFVFLCITCFTTIAQPGYLFTDIAGAFGYHPLSDLGNFRQYSLTAGGAHTDEWAFLVNNNFGSCAAPSCAVWRHYNAGGALIPFNTVIAPNPGGNYGALYNDNTSGLNNGSPSFLQAVTNGNTYTFNFVENGAADAHFSVLETSFVPTNLVGTVTATTGGTINITGLPPGMNPGEVLYCRYTTNGFVTSSIVPVTVIGLNGTAQIPPMTQGTTITYYLYTTNRTQASINTDVGLYGEQAHDLSSLRLLNNGGTNYSFTFGGPVIVLSSTGTNTNATVYARLGLAFNTINLAVQHTGMIQIWINGNTTETAIAALTTGANFTSMVINPAGGATRSVTGSLSGSTLVRMDGADNVTIDGLNTGGNALIFENTANTGPAISTLFFTNDASNHTIRNCTFRGSTITNLYGVIRIDNGVGTTGNDNITIENNIITASGTNLPRNGIYAGAAAPVCINDNIQILNNYISDYYNPTNECAGIYLDVNNRACVISGNHIYQTAARTPSTASTLFTGIDIKSSSNDNITITNNYVGGSAPFCGGGPLILNGSPVFKGIKCTSATAVGTSIQGNIVENIAINTTSPSNVQAGISLETGKFFVGNTSPNTIQNITINFNPALTPIGAFTGILTSGGIGGVIVLSGNIIKSLTATTTTNKTCNLFGIATAAAAADGAYTVTNNQIGGTLTTDSLINKTIGSGALAGIRLALNTNVTQLVSNNLVSGLQGYTGGVIGITLSGNSTFMVLDNTIKRLKNKAAANFDVVGISYGSSTANARHFFNGNTIDSIFNITTSNIRYSAGFNINSGNISNFSLKNNSVKNIVSTNGQAFGLNSESTMATAITPGDTIADNSFRDLYAGGIGYGIYINSTLSTQAAASYISNNSIKNLNAGTTGMGIYKQTLAATVTHVLNNTIDSLIRTGNIATNTVWTGIYLNQTGNTHTATISGNSIRNILINSAPSLINGIYTVATGTGNFPTLSINNNVLDRLIIPNTITGTAITLYGIALTGDIRNTTVSQNTLRNMKNGYSFSSLTFNTCGIYCSSPSAFAGSPFMINNNDIYNVENIQLTSGTSPIAGVYISLPATAPLTLSANNIRCVSQRTSDNNAPIYGIYIDNASGTVVNNMIRLGHYADGTAITAGYQISGISVQSGNTNFNHNSIYIGGTGVIPVNPTAAFLSISPAGSVRNNILMNARSSIAPSSIPNAAISLLSPSVNSNYNLYYHSGNDGVTGTLNTTLYPTLCDWKTAKVSDINSIWGDPNFMNATGDTATVNLHLNSPTPAESAGLGGISTTDFDTDIRNLTNPDIGADEVNFIANPFVVNFSLGVIDSLCFGTTSFQVPYNLISGSPNVYSLSNITPLPGFININNAVLPASPINVNIPGGTLAGNYDFVITMLNQTYCVFEKDTFTLTIEDYPILNITDPAPVCFPLTVDITDGAVTAGSTLPPGTILTYWNDFSATSSLASPNAVATTGTYFIKAETAVGCSDIDSVHVVVNPTPVLVITDPVAVCSPATVDITDAGVTVGSTLPPSTTLTYWNDFAATSSLASPNAVATTGTYFIKAETGAGCFEVDSVHVVVNPSPALVITDPAAVCFPLTVDITDAGVTVGSTLPPSTTLTYWNDFAATSSLASPNAVATTGTYFIKAETGAGCFEVDSVHVVVNATPVSPPTTTSACTYLSISSSVTLTASGIGGTIEWYGTNTPAGIPLGTGPSLNVSTSGTYYAFIVSISGCYSSSDSATATIRPNPSTDIPSAVGDYWATHAVPQGSWTHYCICEDDYLLLSLELNGQNIGDTLVPNVVSIGNLQNEYSVKMHIIAGNSVHIPASVPYVNTMLNPGGWWVFPRTWDVYPNAQPSTLVGLRHYYKDVDFTNLNSDIMLAGYAPIPSESDLTSYKLLGYDASVKLGDQHNSITNTQISLWGNPFYALAPWVGGTNAPSYPNVHYIEHSISSFSGGGAGGGGNGTPPLPITLVAFDGRNEGAVNLLNWLTENENGMSHFEVERSKDQIFFEKIGEVTAKGSTFPQNGYEFTDVSPDRNATNYYRLKMVDTDGHWSFSPVIAISMSSQITFSLYPIPSNANIYMDITGGEGELGSFEIFNAEGKSVLRWTGEITSVLSQAFDISTFAKGIYFYQFKYNKEVYSGKCVVE